MKTPIKQGYKEGNCLAQSDDVGSVSRAGKGVHIIGVLVGIGTVGVAGRTGGGGAAGVTGNNREAAGDEVGRAIHVDGRQVPVESIAVDGILELENTVGVTGGSRQLDGDTAAIGVDLPVLTGGATAIAEGLHLAGVVGSGPHVDIGTHVVDELDTAGAGGRVTGTVRQSGSSGSEKAGEEDVGEVHLECGSRVDLSQKTVKVGIKKGLCVKRQTKDCQERVWI